MNDWRKQSQTAMNTAMQTPTESKLTDLLYIAKLNNTAAGIMKKENKNANKIVFLILSFSLYILILRVCTCFIFIFLKAYP